MWMSHRHRTTAPKNKYQVLLMGSYAYYTQEDHGKKPSTAHTSGRKRKRRTATEAAETEPPLTRTSTCGLLVVPFLFTSTIVRTSTTVGMIVVRRVDTVCSTYSLVDTSITCSGHLLLQTEQSPLCKACTHVWFGQEIS